MILIIAEKKELARAIVDALAGTEKKVGSFYTKGNYIISYLGGHAMELKDPEEIDEKYKEWKEEDLPIFFYPWPRKVKKEKLGLITQIGQHIKQAEYVIHAGDNDDEGQLLVDEVLEYFRYTGKVMRLDCGNTTKAGLQKAFASLTDNKEHISAGQAAYARAICDKAFGYSLSRHFSLLNDMKLNVGRVKTPTLGLVVNRDRAIEGHKKAIFYDLYVDFSADGKTISLKYEQKDMCQDKSTLDNVIKQLLGKRGTLAVVKRTQTETPPLPFNLVKLQSFCGNAFSYSPDKVMAITQRLRDEYRAITYNRSDCQYLTNDHFLEAPKVVETTLKNLNMEAPADLDTSRKSKAFNDKYVTLHFAIIPSGEPVNIDVLTEEEKNVYVTIANRYLAQFMPPCIKTITEAEVVFSEKKFTATSSVIKDEGYRSLALKKAEEKENILNEIPQRLYPGIFTKFNIKQGETKPPKRYTQSTLNEDLTRIARYVRDPKIKEILLKKDDGKKGENGSIGTVATRSKIISDLIKDGYLRQEGKVIISTELGRQFYDALPDEIKRADTTAIWWLHQEAIIEGKEPPSVLTGSVLKTISHVIRSCREKTFSSGRNELVKNSVGKCPVCGNDVFYVENAKMKAYVCSNKECKFILWKNTFGGQINASNAKRLLAGKESLAIAMRSKAGKEFKAKLKLNNQGKPELIFINNSKQKEG